MYIPYQIYLRLSSDATRNSLRRLQAKSSTKMVLRKLCITKRMQTSRCSARKAQEAGQRCSITVNVYGNLRIENGTPVVVGIVMKLDRSGSNLISNIRTIHARSDFAKQITDDSVLYLNEDKKRTRTWFHVCDNLKVPLDGTMFGFIRSITYQDTKSNRYSVKSRSAESYESEIERLKKQRDEAKRQIKLSKYQQVSPRRYQAHGARPACGISLYSECRRTDQHTEQV